jgi:hypothetical protein
MRQRPLRRTRVLQFKWKYCKKNVSFRKNFIYKNLKVSNCKLEMQPGFCATECRLIR